jgi:hypothetical protein
MLRALEKMAQTLGRSIFIQSGRRTVSEQAALFQKYAGSRPVARPSPNAPHVRGIAADITPGREVFGNAAGRHGLGFTVPSESWHIQLLDAGAVQGGARGDASAPVAPNLGRIRITGRQGATKELAQAAADKVSRAAQRFVDRAEGPTKGGGTSSQNQRLGKRMMTRFFDAGQWPALRELWTRESGWNTTADNPTSDAYGIPQSLPGSKMASAGKDWRTNAATQIKWGLQYIKQRYGSPSAALAFHDSHNWYQRGGFIEEVIREGGGRPDFRAKPPKGLKAPKGGPSPGSGYKWDAAANKWKRKKGKSKKPFRSLPEIDSESGFLRLLGPLEDQLHRIIPSAQERIQSLEDTFALSDEDFYPAENIIPRLRREGHNIQQLGDQFIDWSAVEQKKSELSQLLGEEFGLIGTPFGAPKGLMETLREKLDPIRSSIEAIVSKFSKEIDAIKKQVRENMRKHARNETRIEVLDERINKEQNKDKPDRRKIRGWRGEKSAITEENENLRRANRRLTGESQPSGDLASVEGGELGRRQSVLTSAQESLKEVQSDKEAFTGLSGLGGDFASAKNAISEHVKQLGELTTERIREAITPSSPAEQNRDIRAFIDAITSLQRQFGGNFRPLPSFEGGGRVEAPIGSPVNATVHGGELIVDPRTGALSVKVVDGMPQSKNVTINNHFRTTPEDTHGWSRQMEWDVRTAV